LSITENIKLIVYNMLLMLPYYTIIGYILVCWPATFHNILNSGAPEWCSVSTMTSFEFHQIRSKQAAILPLTRGNNLPKWTESSLRFRSLFVLLHFFFWPLCYQFFDIRILITLFVSSNSSYLWKLIYSWLNQTYQISSCVK
jgi:hypothetical protein